MRSNLGLQKWGLMLERERKAKAQMVCWMSRKLPVTRKYSKLAKMISRSDLFSHICWCICQSYPVFCGVTRILVFRRCWFTGLRQPWCQRNDIKVKVYTYSYGRVKISEVMRTNVVLLSSHRTYFEFFDAYLLFTVPIFHKRAAPHSCHWLNHVLASRTSLPNNFPVPLLKWL